MTKFCIYSDKFQEAPCYAINIKRYSYLKDIFENKTHTNVHHSVPLVIDCLKLDEHMKFGIDDLRCINCMFCAFGCIGNKVFITKGLHPNQLCIDITPDEIHQMEESLLPKLFHGQFIKLPQVPISHIRVVYHSFEEFTAINETRNIAIWGANAMKFLSSSLEPRLALEVNLKIKQRDRGGRLDICLFNVNDKYLFVAETKISMTDMIREGRFEAQMIAYETELQNECPVDIKKCKFLLIGGEESEMLPPDIEGCTAYKAHSDLFYDIICKNHFFFISANAMLALGLMKMFVSQRTYCLENLYEIMTNSNYIGLLSSGVVTKDRKIISFSDINGFIYN